MNDSRKREIARKLLIPLSIAIVLIVSFKSKISTRKTPFEKDIFAEMRSEIVPNETYYGFTARLRLLQQAAYRDHGIKPISTTVDENYALYPRAYHKNISSVLSENRKIYDFCFIGGLETDMKTYQNRKWIIPFIEDNFGPHSYLHLTDKISKSNIQRKIRYLTDYLFMRKSYFYDHSWENTGFVPKYVAEKDRRYFDASYFNIMSQCKFCLCPAGDVLYSMRFYEALMTKCIPIVSSVRETYRSRAESKLGYQYYLSCENIEYRDDWVNVNYDIFLRYHTLEFYIPPINATFIDNSRKHVRKLHQKAIAILAEALTET